MGDDRMFILLKKKQECDGQTKKNDLATVR